MAAYSRRLLARYAVDQLQGGVPMSSLVKSLAASLIETGRAKEADMLVSDIYEELEGRGVLARVRLATATPISTGLKAKLAKELAQAARVKDVNIEHVIEPELIGGFKAETANHAWDKTIARKLADIKGGV